MSLAGIHQVPQKSVILLSGPPGAGKSTFCHEVVLDSLAMDRPVVFVSTEQGPAEIVGHLRDKGMGELPPGALHFVDVFAQTVGLATPQRADTLHANCQDLNSLSMAIAKLQQRIATRDILLAFDSLTSPYLFNKEEMFRFIKLCLLKFAAEGNSVLALVDEGCGKEQDLVAMMSVVDGVIKIEMGKDRRFLNVIKHPRLRATRVEVPVRPNPTIKCAFDLYRSKAAFQAERMRQWVRSMSAQGRATMRAEVGDFVNLFWPNLARWSGMLWDPKRFPIMMYELNKEDALSSTAREMWQFYPRREKLLMKALPALRALGLLPRRFGEVEDMRQLSRQAGGGPWGTPASWERSGAIEYLEESSKTDQHYFRVYESSDCWGFEGVGVAMAWHLPPHMAGRLKGLEQEGRDWQAVETKCIGLGDPYCEFKLVPGEIHELGDSLEKDSSAMERIHERLMQHLMGFLLHDKPPPARPRLGSEVHLHPVVHGFGFPYLALGGERYRMALRMGGARAGKQVGERLMEARLSEDVSIKRVLDFLNYCKVGRAAMRDTITIRENCESLASWLFAITSEPSCYFTTGFLNGLFSAVRNQHVREVKCIAAGDPYCEWEIV